LSGIATDLESRAPSTCQAKVRRMQGTGSEQQ
jgi:hypothetical protein